MGDGSAGERKTLDRVREIFRSPGFPSFFATRAVSQIGDGIFQLAAADVLLFDKPGANPALTLAAISAVTLIPFSLIAPFAGVFIDQWDRRKILTWVPLLRASLAAVVGLGVDAGAAFYLLVLGVLSANRFFLATMSAVLPQFVPQDDLLVANSVASTGGSIANVTGLGVGAGLAAVLGGTRTAAIAAVAFVCGALLARRLRVHRGLPPLTGTLGEELRKVVEEMVEGVRRLRRSSRATYALSAVSLNQALVGSMTAATIVFFISFLDLGVGAVTSLLGVIAAGIGVGVAVVPWIARRVREDRLIPMAFTVAGAIVLIVGTSLSRTSVIAGGAFVGFAYAMTKIPVDTIVQEEMPDSHRGRAFSAYDMLFNLMRVAGTAAAAFAVEAGGTPRAVVVGTGVAYLGGAVVLGGAERRIHAARAEPPAPAVTPSPPEPEPAAEAAPRRGAGPSDPAAFFPVGELVTLRTYAGGRADVEPRFIVVGDREIPVDSVEWRAVEERVSGERRLVFVVLAAGMRVRLSGGDESTRWEVEHVRPAK